MSELTSSTSVEISEIFPTICGEGFEHGIAAVFVRTSRCGVGCVYCDSTYTFSAGKFLSIGEIVEEVLRAEKVGRDSGVIPLDSRNVFITGGEPVIAKNIDGLIKELKSVGFKIMFQTSARLFRPEVFDLVDYLSVDVKGPSAKLKEDVLKKCLENVEKIYFQYVLSPDFNQGVQFKFNIDDDSDYDFFLNWARVHKHASIYIQPLAPPYGEKLDQSTYIDKYRWLLFELCMDHHEEIEEVSRLRRNPLSGLYRMEKEYLPIQVGYQDHKLDSCNKEEYEIRSGKRFTVDEEKEHE